MKNTMLPQTTSSNFALTLDGHGGSVSVPLVDITELDKQPLWCHLDKYAPQITDQLKLDDEVQKAILSEIPRPRLAHMDGGLLLFMRCIKTDAQHQHNRDDNVNLWIDQHKILTSSNQTNAVIADMLALFDNQVGPKNSAEFLVKFVEVSVEAVVDCIDVHEDTMTDFEEALLENDSDLLRKQLSKFRRKIIALHRYLIPQRDLLARLTREQIAWLTEYHHTQLLDSFDTLTHQIEILEAIRERALFEQEELHSLTAEKLNSRIYILSLVAAIFLPLSFITGLLGVNVEGIPGAKDPYAFEDVLIILAVVLVFLIVIFRSKKWF